MIPTEISTLPDFLRVINRMYGDRPAVVQQNTVLTYRQLDEDSQILGRQLLARGVGKGTRIGLLLANGPEFAVALAAVSRIGGIAIPLSTFMRGRELGRVIRHADLHGLIAQSRILGQNFVEQLPRAMPDLVGSKSALVLASTPYLRWIVLSGDDHPGWARTPEWFDKADIQKFDSSVLVEIEREVYSEDLALMIYTSGQSADPKGVPHTHRTVVGKVQALAGMMGVTDAARPIAFMPFFWVGGLALSLLTTLYSGGLVVCPVKPTEQPPPLGAVHRAVADDPPPGYKAHPSLGMTETFATYAWGKVSSVPGRNYVPIDFLGGGYEMKVVDPEGQTVSEGERGEIVVRGADMTPGYYKVPRRQSFDADGFFRTGDEGEVEGERVHFVGRLGDMIKTRMANVSPPEVERELVLLPEVAGAYVAALDDPERGQVVGAAVIGEVGALLDVESMAQELRKELSVFKVPRVIAFVSNDEVPLTPTNKVDRRALADLIARRGIRVAERTREQ